MGITRKPIKPDATDKLSAAPKSGGLGVNSVALLLDGLTSAQIPFGFDDREQFNRSIDDIVRKVEQLKRQEDQFERDRFNDSEIAMALDLLKRQLSLCDALQQRQRDCIGA